MLIRRNTVEKKLSYQGHKGNLFFRFSFFLVSAFSPNLVPRSYGGTEMYARPCKFWVREYFPPSLAPFLQEGRFAEEAHHAVLSCKNLIAAFCLFPFPGRVHPSLEMASMPSDRNYANTIDWSISSDLTSPPMTIVEVPLILQEESSDKIVRS